MKTFKNILTTALVAVSAASFAQSTLTSTIDSSSYATYSTTKPARAIDHITSGLHVYVGVNNFGGSLPADYDFRPLGSRYVALSWQKRIPLATMGSAKLRLVTGPEIAWNNFMFERSPEVGRNVLVERNNQLVIEKADTDLHKSKLVTTQLNLPVLLNVTFRSGLSVGVGAYAGIRLDSYTKVKPEGGSSVRTHGSYSMNPVRWGLTTELGFRGQAKLFGRYEPNSPFKSGQGPDASVWAVGIKF